MQPSEELTMGSISQIADAMVKSFQKLDLAARHDVREQIYKKVTGRLYRQSTQKINAATAPQDVGPAKKSFHSTNSTD